MQRGLFIASVLGALAPPTPGVTPPSASATAQIAELEHRAGGRLGVFALDTAGGRRIGYRETERFPMCSTFKVVAVAAVLARVDRGAEHLDRRIVFTAKDLLDYAPVTKAHLTHGWMTVAALCAAAIEWSDNTAANLLLASMGGPAHVTRYARSIGDSVFRLDRNEPSLNTATPGDLRDTTTPEAMARTLQVLTLGNALSKRSRDLLTTWLRASQIGNARLRAGVPKAWQAADKTGTGAHGSCNDIALFWPPKRSPLIVVAYFTESLISDDSRNAVLANVGRIASRIPREA